MSQTRLLKAAGPGQEISAREARKLAGIMAEFFEATERLWLVSGPREVLLNI
jgi:hypothetical protein